MQKKDLIHFLETLGVQFQVNDFRKSYIRNIVISCPFAKWTHKNGVDRKLGNASILVAEQPHLFHCFSCEQGSGTLGIMLDALLRRGFPEEKHKELVAMLDEDEKNFFSEGLFDGVDTREFNKLRMNKYTAPTTRVYDYLMYRNIAIDCIDKYEILQDGDYLVLPMLDFHKDIVGAAKRLISTDKSDRRKRWLYETGTCSDLCLFGEQFMRGGDDAVLVEGQFDVLYLDGFKPGVIPLGANGNSVSGYQIDVLKRLGSLTVMADGDEGGHKLERSAKKFLSEHIPLLFKAKLPDGTDPADLPREELVRIFDDRELF